MKPFKYKFLCLINRYKTFVIYIDKEVHLTVIMFDLDMIYHKIEQRYNKYFNCI